MQFSLDDAFPNISNGLENIGFFFGAGASFEAGYPLTKKLTVDVISKLDAEEKDVLSEILEKEELSEDEIDIEVISDIIYKHVYSDKKFKNLEKSIQNKIVRELLSVTDPKLDYHIQFLKSIKKLSSNISGSIWIFTTNYDMLFERAAMDARIPIFNGFEGIFYRYFDLDKINLDYGNIRNSKFELFKEPKIKLIKLHGSVSWFKKNEEIFETCKFDLFDAETRSLILPRRNKIIEALDHPYDKLLRYASQIIGNQCKYILSCGYSFRDQHINDLIIPKLRDRKIRLTALFDIEPESVGQLAKFNNFYYLTNSKYRVNGNENSNNLDVWKFSKLVNLLSIKAGLGEIND